MSARERGKDGRLLARGDKECTVCTRTYRGAHKHAQARTQARALTHPHARARIENTFTGRGIVHEPVSGMTATRETDNFVLAFVLTGISALTFIDVAVLFVGEVGTVFDAVAKEQAGNAKIIRLTFEVVRARATRVGLKRQ